MTRHLVEKGRVVSFKDKCLWNALGVIVDFHTQTNFIVQMVCAETGDMGARVFMSAKFLVLTEWVVKLDESETLRGEALEASIKEELRSQQIVEKFQKSFSYVEMKERESFKKMNDFERFLVEEREKIKASLLRSKGF